MFVLISNDDGYRSKGLKALKLQLDSDPLINKVIVVAPENDKSGASHSLTLDRPLRCHRVNENVYRVDGTPSDCVHLALTCLLDEQTPDIVVSGINQGANMGDDVIYSGTVAAATEGRFLGLPAIAVSIASHTPRYFETAARALSCLLEKLPELDLPSDSILNVNVPDIPWSGIQGFVATRLGKRHKAEGVVKQKDPSGRDIYWIGPVGDEADAGEGTDFYAVRSGYISITPLKIDLTRYNSMDNVGKWLQSFE